MEKQNPGKFYFINFEIFQDFELVSYQPLKPHPKGRGKANPIFMKYKV